MLPSIWAGLKGQYAGIKTKMKSPECKEIAVSRDIHWSWRANQLATAHPRPKLPAQLRNDCICKTFEQ